MQIHDFIPGHIPAAMEIAGKNYEEERRCVPALPYVNRMPDLTPYAQNGLGAAAFEGDVMTGFLCCTPPFNNAFGSTNARGVFSPMGANGAIGENRADIYARLYQAAADKWVHAGASSHAVCLYAREKEVQEQFFRYGFGLRCVDAIRRTDLIPAPPCQGYVFQELPAEQALDVLPLENLLDQSYIASPFFMFREQRTKAAFLEEYEHFHSIYFTASHHGRPVAFLRAELDGETFVCGAPGYLHVKGAYCLPEHRGKGLNQKLLSLLVRKLRDQGYSSLGVDFESMNPSGQKFWLKYFDAYTHSVVRRIDEKALFA